MARKTTPNSDAGGPRRRRPVWMRGLYWGAVGGIWLVILGIIGAIYLSRDLPDLANLPPPGQNEALVIKADDGRTLASYGAIYGDWLSFRDIPDVLLTALLAVEDRRFFDHPGVDPRGIGRAMISNMTRQGGLQGGSTLTQQLAKNLFLSPDRTIKRKVQEALLALWLEKKLDKAQILTLYLNRVYFGAGAYGVDAASRTYFGHDARTLSLAEAAMLAGLLKAPSSYAPTRSYERATNRAAQVLDAMVDVDALTPEAASRAKQSPARLSPDAMGGDVRFFTDWAAARARELVPDPGEPLVVYTSIDTQAQAAAQRSLARLMTEEGIARQVQQGAIVAMAPDGAIRALVGGVSYARSQYNRATQARRQPGSAFKPFVYLAGLEAGLRPDDRLPDAPITVDGWSPTNFDDGYRGPVTLREAFSGSINTVAVRVSETAGREAVVTTARRLGIDAPLQAVPSIALGAEEVSLLDLTGAYGPLANGGFRVRPYAILEIHTLDGELLYRAMPPERERVVAPGPLADLTAMMQATITEGTGRAARIDRPAAGKTGTSQDFRDALFVGFTSDLVAGVWVGNDDGTPMRGVTGGSLPARIWSDFMIEAHVGHPVRPLMIEQQRAAVQPR